MRGRQPGQGGCSALTKIVDRTSPAVPGVASVLCIFPNFYSVILRQNFLHADDEDEGGLIPHDSAR